ncbi:MAG: tRNA dihydrouridine synthase DusB [Clostridia bacterium]|nr:tRNA dihydrouridine synthase DusB [Clostridia bacterium]
MKIGSLQIRGCAALAPMAGVADRAMRELCVSYGASYVIGEMASSKGISMHDRKSAELLQISDDERPAGVQLFGDDPLTMAKAAEKALEYKPEFLDINMGCPAPKVAGNGGGSALMKRPELASQIVRECVRAVPIPVTVKMRIGWDAENLNAPYLAALCEQAGAAAITVHGRTRVQMYAPPVDRAQIRAVKQAVSVPVIGNGDVTDGRSAQQMLDETGCDFLMVGRGALGRPWVFRQIDAFLERGEIIPDPPLEEQMRVMLDHIRSLCAYKGDYIGMREARKHAAWYIRGIRGAASYRNRIGQLTTIEQIEALAADILAENGT